MSKILSSPPQDLISKIQFSANGERLLVASWDNTVRVYSSLAGSLQSVSDMSAPLWDACWSRANPGLIYAAGLERVVYEVNTETRRLTQMGRDHGAAVTSVISRDYRVISGSLDKTIQYTDVRSSPSDSKFVDLPGKVFAMDASDDGNMVVVGMDNRLIHVYDIRGNALVPVIERESTLRYGTRAIKCVQPGLVPGGAAYVVSSIEGRAALEYVDPQTEGFGFRCHRAKTAQEDVALPVNTLAFHPKTGCLYTGGSDHALFSWDVNTKKKLKFNSKFALSVMSVDVASDGRSIAVGVSDDRYREDPLTLGSDLVESQIHVLQLA